MDGRVFELYKTTLLSNVVVDERVSGHVFELYKTTLLSNLPPRTFIAQRSFRAI